MNADCDHRERRHRPLLYGAAAAALVVTGSITAYLVIGRTPAPIAVATGSAAPSAQPAVITSGAGSAAAPGSSTAPTPGQLWAFPPARVSAGAAPAAAPSTPGAGTPIGGTPIGHVVPVSTVGAASVVVSNSAPSPAVVPASEGGSMPARESTPPSAPTRPGVPLRTASNPEAASTPMPAAPSPLGPLLSPPPVAPPEVAVIPPASMPAPLPEAGTPPPASSPLLRTVRGKVVDGRGAPLRGASIWAGTAGVATDPDGRFAVEAPAEGRTMLVVKAPGYVMRRVPVEDAGVVALKPHVVRAAYLTYYGIAEPRIRDRVVDLVGRTELNAVVIDFKGDRGLVPFRTEVRAAVEAGALGPVIIKDFDGLLRSFRERGIYTIARIVAFKDNVLAHHRPDLAIIDSRTGKPWIDNEKLAWVDPFREEVWDYLIALGKEAAARGFDEVQFDYVRFPTDGRLSAAVYSRPNNASTRLPAIAGFLAKARRELGPTGVFLAADVFGYTAFNANDTDIGQRVEELTPHLDYICPMVYPSGYHLGIPGYRNPVMHPYEVVRESVRLIRQRSQHTTVQVRPWLQDFRDYAFDRRTFGTREVRAQIKGALDGGGIGFMLWNPRNDYTADALLPKTAAVRRPPI